MINAKLVLREKIGTVDKHSIICAKAYTALVERVIKAFWPAWTTTYMRVWHD